MQQQWPRAVVKFYRNALLHYERKQLYACLCVLVYVKIAMYVRNVYLCYIICGTGPSFPVWRWIASFCCVSKQTQGSRNERECHVNAETL